MLAGEEGQRAELRKHIGVEDLSELMLDGAGMGLVAFKGVGGGGGVSSSLGIWDKCNNEKCKAVLQWDQYSLGILEWDQYSLEILEWDQYNRASAVWIPKLFFLMSIVLSGHPGVQLDTRVDSKKSFCRSVMEGT